MSYPIILETRTGTVNSSFSVVFNKEEKEPDNYEEKVVIYLMPNITNQHIMDVFFSELKSVLDRRGLDGTEDS